LKAKEIQEGKKGKTEREKQKAECRRQRAERGKRKAESGRQEGQNRRQKAERIEKIEAEGYREAPRGWGREFTTYAITYFIFCQVLL